MVPVNDACITLIKSFEGLYLHAYLDPVEIPTIGWGTIRYPNGHRVKIGDEITRERAEELLRWEVGLKAEAIDPLLRDDLTPNQYGALVSFAYNLGEGALKVSTLRKKVNINPNDISIGAQFSLWVYAHNKDGTLIKLKGLQLRRAAEWKLYRTKN